MTDDCLHDELLLDGVFCRHHDVLKLDLVRELFVELALATRDSRLNVIFFRLLILVGVLGSVRSDLMLGLFVAEDIVLLDLVVPLVPEAVLGVEEQREEIAIALREEVHIDALQELEGIDARHERLLNQFLQESAVLGACRAGQRRTEAPDKRHDELLHNLVDLFGIHNIVVFLLCSGFASILALVVNWACNTLVLLLIFF